MCIPCSFHQRKPVEGTYSNCLQDQYSCAIDRFRLSINFDCYIGCFKCGFPEFICSKRGKIRCQQPLLRYNACWIALCLDKWDGPRLLELLGGPLGEEFSPTSPIPASVIRWLEIKWKLSGEEICNAAYFLYNWFDHLET